MPLGNSITQGITSGVVDEDFQVSYRKALWDLLVAAGYDVDFVGSLDQGSAVFADSQHEGHPGWKANQIRDNIYSWLDTNPADIILLHIGTNDINEPQNPVDIAIEVSQILDEIDRYEADHSADITVILALIINRLNYVCGDGSTTTTFNDDVYDMALDRINSGDRIEIVDMECGADIDYREQPTGDMWDTLHPFETGYEKMADTWFSGLQAILTEPTANFSADPVSGIVPLTSDFTDHSFGNIDTWEWDFGDDSPLSNEQYPTHTYENPGLYTVSLTVTGIDGSDTETKTDYISVNPPPCKGDFDSDGDVDGSDLAVFASDFGQTNCGSAPSCEGDFDSDGDVDGSDFAVFGANLGRTDCLLVFETRVSTSSNDAEESTSGFMSLTSGDLELVNANTNQTVGIRFNSVDVPQGSTIVNAYVQFKVDETSSETTLLTIEGEDIDDAAPFVSSNGNISSRPRTLTNVSWSAAPWTTLGEAGPDQRTPNIASIIKELVDRPGWLSGNSLAIIITGSGKRVAESYDGDPSGAPLLQVEYTLP